MKKLITLLLTLIMIFVFTACGDKQESNGGEDAERVMGVLNSESSYEEGLEHLKEYHTKEDAAAKWPTSFERYDTLTSMLVALKTGDIHILQTNKYTAQYIVAHNSDLMTARAFNSGDVGYSMMTMDSNEELYQLLNESITKLTENGTIDSLKEEQLNSYIESDPTPKALPHFEGAKTYKIAVTGDLPPMDFVTADGEAAGFNVALLTEIANLTKVNFELLQVDTGARTSALASGKVDAVFWTDMDICEEHDLKWALPVDNVSITEAYLFANTCVVMPESNK